VLPSGQHWFPWHDRLEPGQSTGSPTLQCVGEGAGGVGVGAGGVGVGAGGVGVGAGGVGVGAGGGLGGDGPGGGLGVGVLPAHSEHILMYVSPKEFTFPSSSNIRKL
jgi:hypothetical protein